MLKLFLLLLNITTVLAQAQQINGVAKDETGAPLNGATVSLIKATDSSTIKLAITKANGVYSFTDIKEGNYKVMASHVGYKPMFSSTFALGSADVTVPGFQLS